MIAILVYVHLCFIFEKKILLKHFRGVLVLPDTVKENTEVKKTKEYEFLYIRTTLFHTIKYKQIFEKMHAS